MLDWGMGEGLSGPTTMKIFLNFSLKKNDKNSFILNNERQLYTIITT